MKSELFLMASRGRLVLFRKDLWLCRRLWGKQLLAPQFCDLSKDSLMASCAQSLVLGRSDQNTKSLLANNVFVLSEMFHWAICPESLYCCWFYWEEMMNAWYISRVEQEVRKKVGRTKTQTSDPNSSKQSSSSVTHSFTTRSYLKLNQVSER